MFKYQFNVCDYECEIYEIEVMHEKEFTYEEWQDICEDALTLVYEKQIEMKKIYVSPTPSNGQTFILEHLSSLGFIKTEKAEQTYFINPFCAEIEEIRNEKLKQWVESLDKQCFDGFIEKPKYMRGI